MRLFSPIIFLVAALVLTACGGNENTDETDNGTDETNQFSNEANGDLPIAVNNDLGLTLTDSSDGESVYSTERPYGQLVLLVKDSDGITPANYGSFSQLADQPDPLTGQVLTESFKISLLGAETDAISMNNGARRAQSDLGNVLAGLYTDTVNTDSGEYYFIVYKIKATPLPDEELDQVWFEEAKSVLSGISLN